MHARSYSAGIFSVGEIISDRWAASSRNDGRLQPKSRNHAPPSATRTKTAVKSKSFRVWAKDHPGVRRKSHGLTKMWVIDGGPEPINGFAIRLRLVRDHLPDCPQSEFENGVAAAFECRLYRGGMDELPYSPNRNAGNEMMSGWHVFPQNILRRPNGSFNYAISVHDRSNTRGPRTFHRLRVLGRASFV
jgi:hypothetical protein